jgi:hypothetical protein
MKKTGPGSGGAGRDRRIADAGSRPQRESRKVYLLTREHLAVLHELDRLFPDLAPVLDLGGMRLGAESVDLVSQKLAEVLARRFEQPLFMAFCQVNSERLQDVIQGAIDEEAAPFDAELVLGDLYFRCFERWFQSSGEPMPARSNARAPRRGRSIPDPIFDALASEGRGLVRERVRQIQGLSLPLPGMPFPDVSPARETVERAESLLVRNSCRIEVSELLRWVAFSLLALPLRPRRLLHLRFDRGLSAKEIAPQLGTTPLGVLIEARAALIDLDDRIVDLLERFYGREFARPGAGRREESVAATGAEGSSSPGRASRGKLISFRRNRPGTTARPTPTETDGEPEDDQ